MEPPFTNVGLDVFGPWTAITRRTRGGQANNKRGPAKQIRSDCGSNFTGACKELGMLLTDPAEPSVRKYLGEKGCTWIFNPPQSFGKSSGNHKCQATWSYHIRPRVSIPLDASVTPDTEDMYSFASLRDIRLQRPPPPAMEAGQLDDLVYRIQKNPKTKVKVVHHDKLKPYHSRTPLDTSWVRQYARLTDSFYPQAIRLVNTSSPLLLQNWLNSDSDMHPLI
ncbi:hypothetical protein NFI96_011571 [Prochilodus magdalenae]|nr:hypothetical protein NFI96_011571 [Prochilodus magdalenae]